MSDAKVEPDANVEPVRPLNFSRVARVLGHAQEGSVGGGMESVGRRSRTILLDVRRCSPLRRWLMRRSASLAAGSMG